jgi:hypothetical protein
MKNDFLFFRAACLLSIIGSSIGFLLFAATSIFYVQTVPLIRSITHDLATEKTSPGYFSILMVFHFLSLIGALKLSKFKKTGLFFYLSGQVAILFWPVVWLGWNTFSVSNAIFILIFSGVYLFHFRYLN